MASWVQSCQMLHFSIISLRNPDQNGLVSPEQPYVSNLYDFITPHCPDVRLPCRALGWKAAELTVRYSLITLNLMNTVIEPAFRAELPLGNHALHEVGIWVTGFIITTCSIAVYCMALMHFQLPEPCASQQSLLGCGAPWALLGPANGFDTTKSTKGI